MLRRPRFNVTINVLFTTLIMVINAIELVMVDNFIRIFAIAVKVIDLIKLITSRH